MPKLPITLEGEIEAEYIIGRDITYFKGRDVGTKLGGRPRPLRGIDPSLVPDPRT